VTKVRVTALSISSTHMNITSGFRRTSSPTAPIENRNEPSTMYQAGVTRPTAITEPRPASVASARAASALPQRVIDDLGPLHLRRAPLAADYGESPAGRW
jgi:hypothetical protein